MPQLNYKHLRYFWMVARSGTIARACKQLHLTPQAISGQLRELEEALGVELFHRVGRGLEVTDAGRRILSYADEIFALGQELLDIARDQTTRRSLPFAVGISDSVAKLVAHRLIEPVLCLPEAVRLICREGRLTPLLAELAVHRLDLVIADRPMPANLNVRCFSHLLTESDLTVFGAEPVLDKLDGNFPALLQGAPFLLPGDDVAIRTRIEEWFATERLHPRIVGEFDDSALLKSFAQGGAGLFVAPSAIADDVAQQYGVRAIGRIASISEQVYAITTERLSTHPATVAIIGQARSQASGNVKRSRRVKAESQPASPSGTLLASAGAASPAIDNPLC